MIVKHLNQIKKNKTKGDLQKRVSQTKLFKNKGYSRLIPSISKEIRSNRLKRSK